MPKKITDVIQQIESYIQYEQHEKKIVKELENNLKIFYTIDKNSLIKYIEMLFDSDFERSVYADVFIKFICSISSDDILILIENVYKKLTNKNLKKLLIQSCTNTTNYKIKFFLYKLTNDLIYSTEAKLSLLLMGDSTFESDLLEEYKKKLDLGIFLSKYLESLSKSGSRRVWKITNEFINKDNIDQRDRFRILNYILKLDEKNAVSTLISLFKYYNKHRELTEENALDITLKLNIKKKYVANGLLEYKDNKDFVMNILQKIIYKLKKYSYLTEVRDFFDSIQKN